MDAQEKQTMIEKIMKLLELGKDDNGAYTHEQEVANTMAAKLMAKYSIDFSDLRSHKTARGCVFEHHKIDPLDVVYCGWEASLAYCIGKTFDCRVVNTRHPVWVLNFMGTKADLEISIFFYRHLRRTVGRKSEVNFSRKADRDTYATAMVNVITTRLEDLYKKKTEVMDADCRALMVVKTDGLSNYVGSIFPKLVKSRKRTLNGSHEAWMRGQADGAKVNLNRPIAHAGAAKQIK